MNLVIQRALKIVGSQKRLADNTNHGIQISFTTKITGRGQQWLTRKLLDNGMLKVTGEAA